MSYLKEEMFTESVSGKFPTDEEQYERDDDATSGPLKIQHQQCEFIFN